ncbi:MAG: dockerin type I repeat-containing protein, partial [Clostridia bacterium]|nr:dockerin type I repeat-containing protein [Clostridia bacterium]
QLCMWFVAKEGYVFNPYALPEITMPGYDAEITDVELFDGVLYVLTDYMAAEQPYRETITSVQINGFERPKAGETAISNILKLSVPSNAPYTISDVEWVTYDTPHELRDGGGFFSAHVLDNHETFEDGEWYWLRVYLTPKEGYRFDYDEIEQVKGIPYVNGWVEDDGSVFCAVTDNVEVGGFMYGDMDFDGEITVADALRALRIAAKLVKATDEDMLTGDVDGDDAITVADALKILRVAAKLADRDSLDPRGPR